MANTPDDASKQPPSVPDLKKAAEAKAAQPYVWAPTAKSAASAPGVLGAPRREPTAFERLNTTGGRLAVMAGLMLVVGGGISLTAFHDAGGAGGSSDLSKPNSTIKSRAFYEKDGVSLARGRDDSTANRMKVGAKPGAAGGPMANPLDGIVIPEAPEGGEGEAMNYDESGGKGKSVASAAGAAGQNANGGAQGGGGTGAFSAGGVAAPKLSSTGKIKFQGMRRISGTAGFRGIGGRQGTPSKINTRGSSANTGTADAGGRGGSRGGTGFSSLAEGGGARGGDRGSASQADAGGGAGGNGGGSGGGGGSVNTDGLDDIENALPSIPDLLSKAASSREKAESEEKKGHALMVLGQHPQAHYHFDKAKKYKKEAKGYEDQANQQTQMMTDTAAGMTTTTPPP